jgi:hypothetical protein
MGKFTFTLAAVAIFAAAFGAGKIDGIFGIKFGEKPSRAVEVKEIRPLRAKIVMLTPDNDEIQQCLAIVGTNGFPVAVTCETPWSVAEARSKVVDSWTVKYGKPSISGAEGNDGGPSVEFDTFVSADRALLFVRQDDRVMLGCADVTSLTNMLAHAEGSVAAHEREALKLLGKVVGYGTEKKSSEGKQPLSKEDK